MQEKCKDEMQEKVREGAHGVHWNGLAPEVEGRGGGRGGVGCGAAT